MIVYVAISVLIGVVIGSIEGVVPGIITGLLWPVGLAISVYEAIKRKLI
jgi:TctA family transporter